MIQKQNIRTRVNEKKNYIELFCCILGCYIIEINIIQNNKVYEQKSSSIYNIRV